MKTPAQIWSVEPSAVMPAGFKSRLKIASAYPRQTTKRTA